MKRPRLGMFSGVRASSKSCKRYTPNSEAIEGSDAEASQYPSWTSSAFGQPFLAETFSFYMAFACFYMVFKASGPEIASNRLPPRLSSGRSRGHAAHFLFGDRGVAGPSRSNTSSAHPIH